MALEDVLRQNAEISEFLKSLVAVHKRALQEQSLSSQLNKVRRDISICFNDLCTLNEMLISCDGEIKEEIEMLQKSRDKFAKLARKERQLLNQKKLWDQTTAVAPIEEKSTSVTVSASYRILLDQYIELVGASNTSLVNEEVNSPNLESEVASPSELVQSVKLLQSCHERNLKDIQQLNQLLKNFIKDQHFIEKESKIRLSKIRRATNLIDEDLDKIRQSRNKLLSKVGLAFPDAQESSISRRFFHLGLNDDKDNKSQLEQDDIADHVAEFIDMKICSLQDQLTHKKENSSDLVSQRNLWNDCIEAVKTLEDRLSMALANDTPPSAVSSSKLKAWLKETIDELEMIISSTDSDVLIALVDGEREVIEKAYSEIAKDEVKPLSIPEKNQNYRSSSPPKYHSSPPFLVASKSPPKLGISEQTAEPSSGDNNFELNNMGLLKNKSQKKD